MRILTLVLVLFYSIAVFPQEQMILPTRPIPTGKAPNMQVKLQEHA